MEKIHVIILTDDEIALIISSMALARDNIKTCMDLKDFSRERCADTIIKLHLIDVKLENTLCEE